MASDKEYIAELETLRAENERLKRSYRCYSCKQVFEEDNGHGLASQHFGSWLNGDRPKCEDCLRDTASWAGGPHDPFYRVRKEHYDAMQKEIIDLKAEVAKWRARDEADADDRSLWS